MNRAMVWVAAGTAALLAAFQPAIADSSFKMVKPPGGAPGTRVAAAPSPQRDEAPLEAPSDFSNDPSSPASTPVRQILMRSSAGRVLTLPASFSSIHIASPDVVDAVAVTDRKVVLQAKKQGASDIFFFDAKNNLIADLSVEVDDFSNPVKTPTPDPKSVAFKSVEIHNKALLNSQTNFRCGPDGCHYAGEVTVSEPAPLPLGHSEQSGNFTTSGNSSVVPVISTSPPPSPSPPPAR